MVKQQRGGVRFRWRGGALCGAEAGGQGNQAVYLSKSELAMAYFHRDSATAVIIRLSGGRRRGMCCIIELSSGKREW